MLNLTALVSALSGLVGYRPDPAGNVELSVELKKSTSGLYVQDVSELLTLDILRNICPRSETVGAWLARLQNDALSRFASSLVGVQGLSGKVLLPDAQLVKNPGRAADTVNAQGRFVGLQLRPFRKLGYDFTMRGAALTVPSVALQFDAVLPDGFKLYLYSDAQPEPVATLTVLAGNKPYFPFAVSTASLPVLAANTRYWLGYYEDDLGSVHAIQAPVGPCGCASDPYALWSQYVTAEPFTVAPDALNPDYSLFSRDSVKLEGQNFGLILTFSAYCDVVTALQSSDNLLRLAPLVQQAIAIRLYEALASSPNLTQVASRPDLHADALALLYRTQAKLYGGKVPGTEEVYPSALKDVTLDLSGLDPVCGPPVYSPLSVGRLRR